MQVQANICFAGQNLIASQFLLQVFFCLRLQAQEKETGRSLLASLFLLVSISCKSKFVLHVRFCFVGQFYAGKICTQTKIYLQVKICSAGQNLFVGLFFCWSKFVLQGRVCFVCQNVFCKSPFRRPKNKNLSAGQNIKNIEISV